MKVCVLASGSGGNAIFVGSGSGEGAILIDAGLDYAQVRRQLGELGLWPCRILAIFLTHEHGDHCSFASELAGMFGCPIYGTAGTLRALRLSWYLSGGEELRPVELGEEVQLGELRVRSFPVFHDAVEPCGYLVSDGRGNLGVATDLGVVSPAVLESLLECEVVILEANHDLEMLLTGPYPWELKQRIRSEVGHLSNDAAGEALAELARRGRLKVALLAHLSQHNNRPELALQTVERYLNGRAELLLTWQDRPSPVVEL